MFRFAVFSLAAISLSACGGGNTATSGIDVGYNQTGSNTSETIKSYSNGDAVVAVKGILADGGIAEADKPIYYFILSSNSAEVISVFDGAVAWELEDQYYTLENVYSVYREGISNSGKALTADTTGINLNYSGTEYASMTAAEIGDEIAILTSGTTITRLPSGSHSYSGAIIVGIENDMEVGSVLNFSANFNTSTASMTGSTDKYFASANDITIDTTTGSFSTDTALIGEKNSTFTIDAELIGAFAGTNGGGVHGVLYPKVDNSDDGFAIFLGER